MARIEVVMPQMGESIAEGTIIKWHKKVGDPVRKDETLLEISTDKVDSEIPSPASGVLSHIVVAEQKTVPVQTVIAYIESDVAAATAPPASVSAAPPAAPAPVETPGPPREAPAGGRFYSPLVLTIARTEGIGMDELERIPGTGEAGRLTKKDLLAYAKGRGVAGAPPAPAAAPPRPAQPVEPTGLKAKYPAPRHEVLQMTNVMQKMAQHMLHSVQTSPHVAAVHEVDMTDVAAHRASQAAAFERAEGFKLTFMPYIAYAVVQALKKFPLLNSSVEGDKIIKKNYINLGIAVASESGLIVPVVKHAEEKNFIGIARAINDIATRTRTKKLTPDDIQGGTFSISNFGVFGTLIGTPIIAQPQVAILGTGAITQRVAAMNGMIAIRSMAYFTLSFDHRVIDGAMGGMFLEAVVEGLERFDTGMHF